MSQHRQEKPEGKNADPSGDLQTWNWQKRLLPWLILMPTVLVGCFIFMASNQITKFNEALEVRRDSTLIGTILPEATITYRDIKDKERYLKWITLTKLEQESYYRRYSQAGQILMSRIYVKYLGFFTGMILAIVGSVFIIGKLSENPSELEGSAKDMVRFKVVSSSPGVIFGLLGTILMLATIITHNDMEVQDAPLYLNAKNIISLDLLELQGGATGKKPQEDNSDILDKFDKMFPPKKNP
ncbi:MAG: hypothetical protein R8G66_09340 [Cytophagales bacterium]|nr:hypothetical protein [Cytophagales bacterium]